MTGIGSTTPTRKRRASETVDSPKNPPAIVSKRILYDTGIIKVGGRTEEGETNVAHSRSLADMVRGVPDGTGLLSKSLSNPTEGTHGRRAVKVVRKALFGKSSTASPTGAGRVFGRGFAAGSLPSIGDVSMANDAKQPSTDLSTASAQTAQSSQGLRRSTVPSLDLSQLREALPFLSPVKSQPNSEQSTPTSSMGSSPVAQPKQQKLPWG